MQLLEAKTEDDVKATERKVRILCGHLTALLNGTLYFMWDVSSLPQESGEGNIKNIYQGISILTTVTSPIRTGALTITPPTLIVTSLFESK